MAAETHYTGNTGLVSISTANSNLDGTGTLGTVLTGADNGTLIKRIIVKAVDTGSASTSQGMVRLFIYDGANTRLLKEVYIPATGQTKNDRSFETWLPLNFKLESGFVLKASTENADTFNVIAEGLDIDYYTTSVRPESTNYTANTGVQKIDTQNTNLDGSGTVATLVTAATAAAGFNGLAINNITLKAYTDVTSGMLRVFLQNTGTGAANTFLFTERLVIPTDASGTFQSFNTIVAFSDTLQIEAGFKIVATIETTTGEKVAATVDGMDWEYPA